jgi:hypothetical protein
MPDELDAAYDTIRHTNRSIDEIAAEMNLTRAALDARLYRRFGERALTIRSGEARRGRPPTSDEERKNWGVRLTDTERHDIEVAIAEERSAGAASDGEALHRAVTRTGRRSKKK